MSGKKSLQRAYYVNKESEEMDVFKATVNKTSNRQQATVRRELVQRISRSTVQPLHSATDYEVAIGNSKY
jgi:hypothetical protein